VFIINIAQKLYVFDSRLLLNFLFQYYYYY